MMGGADGLDSEVKDTKNGNNSTHRIRTNKKIRGPFTLKVGVNIISTILPSPSQKIQDLKVCRETRMSCPGLTPGHFIQPCGVLHESSEAKNQNLCLGSLDPHKSSKLPLWMLGARFRGRKLLLPWWQPEIRRGWITSWYETYLPICTKVFIHHPNGGYIARFLNHQQ